MQIGTYEREKEKGRKRKVELNEKHAIKECGEITTSDASRFLRFPLINFVIYKTKNNHE